MPLRRLLGLSLLVLGAGAVPAARAGEPVSACSAYATAVRVGAVPRALRELSGLAASRRHAGLFWAHNDSGNALALVALRADGRVAATFPVRGATARDPEDVAVGPCEPGGRESCVYLGDIGDNLGRRPSVQILKVREPARLDGRPLAATPLPFVYPDGPRNAEALAADPLSGRLFVVTKALFSLGDVYRLDDLGARAGGRAVRVATLEAPGLDLFTTAADAHPSGERLLVLTAGRAWELRRPGARSLEEVLVATPVPVPGPEQLQAEAAAYVHDGRGYLLGGEGAGSPLSLVRCQR